MLISQSAGAFFFLYGCDMINKISTEDIPTDGKTENADRNRKRFFHIQPGIGDWYETIVG